MPSIHRSPSGNKRVLYLAAPIDLFFTPSGVPSPMYQAALRATKTRFPELKIFESAPEFDDTPDSLFQIVWPDLLPRIHTLVVVPRLDGSIGAGCVVSALDFASVQLYGAPVPLAHPGRVRLANVANLYVWEAGSLTPLRWLSPILNGPPSRLALVGSGGDVPHMAPRRAEAVAP